VKEDNEEEEEKN